MTNVERLAQFQGQDFTHEGQRPIEKKSFENLRRFLAKGAIAPLRTNATGEKPDYSDRRIYYPSIKTSMSLQKWERNLWMTYDYGFKEETLEEIGKRNGNLTREAARQIIKKTVRSLYNEADEEARDRFLFESFDFKKPRTLASRQRFSEAHGGISLQIARRLEQGATLDELKNDYTTDQVSSARPIVESWGYKLKREKTPILPQFEDLKNLDATDSEIQTLLDKITTSQCGVLKQACLVVDLTTVAKKAGLYIPSDQIHFISESLRKELLPQTKVPFKTKDKNGQEKIYHYHIIATTDEPNAIDILKNDHNLDDLRINPVGQIAGPTAKKLPNTYELASEEYGSVGTLIADIKGWLRWSGRDKGGIKTADIINGSPVPIYIANNDRRFSYRKDQKEKLRKHLESRMRQLGMI